MSRKATPVFICLAVLVLGCEKKKPEAAPPVRVAPRAGAVPAGTTPIAEGERVFVSKKPLTVAQYLQYLETTDQAIPDRWTAVAPGSAEADKPVTGLSRQEAAHCATFHLKQLPTPEQWQKAAAVVGERPYPWTPDGTPAAPSAEVFLVQSWTPGSDGEFQARQAKANLGHVIMGEHLKEVERLRAELEAATGGQGAGQEAVWRQLKPAYFALLDEEKKLAELIAARESRAEVLEVLNRLGVAKVKMGAALAGGGLSPEAADKAVNAYTDLLSKTRADVQAVRDDLQKSVAAMQDQVVALTREFEAAGVGEPGAALQQAQAALAESAAPAGSTEQAVALEARLQAALGALRGRVPALKLPDMDKIRARTADVEQQARELSGEDPASVETRDVRQKMDQVGRTIERDFLQEKLLFQELDDLVDLRARKKATEAKLKSLRQALGKEAAVPAA